MSLRPVVSLNGYEFLLPKQRTPEQRYVVWTGGDGTPHVQPVVSFEPWTAKGCASAAKPLQSTARVSPDALLPCMAPPIVDKPAAPLLRRGSRTLRLRRQVAQMLHVMRCVQGGPVASGVVIGGRPLPVPPLAVPPARPVAPPSAAPARPVPAPSAVPPVRKPR